MANCLTTDASGAKATVRVVNITNEDCMLRGDLCLGNAQAANVHANLGSLSDICKSRQRNI
jgi:hypothetical protein